jgi:nucleoid DNA-binding protein
MVKSKKEIIQAIATKYNMPLEKIEQIVNSQFKYVSKIMADGTFDSVRLPYFGKFSSKASRRDIITKKKNGFTGDS